MKSNPENAESTVRSAATEQARLAIEEIRAVIERAQASVEESTATSDRLRLQTVLHHPLRAK